MTPRLVTALVVLLVAHAAVSGRMLAEEVVSDTVPTVTEAPALAATPAPAPAPGPGSASSPTGIRRPQDLNKVLHTMSWGDLASCAGAFIGLGSFDDCGAAVEGAATGVAQAVDGVVQGVSEAVSDIWTEAVNAGHTLAFNALDGYWFSGDVDCTGWADYRASVFTDSAESCRSYCEDDFFCQAYSYWASAAQYGEEPCKTFGADLFAYQMLYICADPNLSSGYYSDTIIWF